MKTLTILFGFVLFTTSAWAMPLDYMTTDVNAQTQTVAFTLHFDGVPDFQSTDQYGRQADSFQFFIYNTPRTNLFDQRWEAGSTVYVNGEELHAGNGLPIRNLLLLPSDPLSLRERDPILQQGNLVSFTSSFAGLGVSGFQPFGYGHVMFAFGDSQNSFFGACSSDRPCAAPEPSSLLLLGLGFVGLAGVMAWRRMRPA